MSSSKSISATGAILKTRRFELSGWGAGGNGLFTITKLEKWWSLSIIVVVFVDSELDRTLLEKFYLPMSDFDMHRTKKKTGHVYNSYLPKGRRIFVQGLFLLQGHLGAATIGSKPG